MLKLAVVGKDVSASDSPAIHSYILPRLGAACSYDKVSVPPAEFSARAEQLFERYDAFNVTIPFKGEIIPFLKEVKGDARVFGAVNTVTTKDRAGYNTDGAGFMLMLRNEGIQTEGKRALVLGAGGAGRSVIKKLTEGGAEVFAYERDEERLLAVHREFGGFVPCTKVATVPYDLIVNCTGVGMHDTVGKLPSAAREEGTAPVDDLLQLCGAAVDLIYVPAESEFLLVARMCGKRTVNGAAMLFYQAYFADCIFLGREPQAEEAKQFYLGYTEGKR